MASEKVYSLEWLLFGLPPRFFLEALSSLLNAGILYPWNYISPGFTSGVRLKGYEEREEARFERLYCSDRDVSWVEGVVNTRTTLDMFSILLEGNGMSQMSIEAFKRHSLIIGGFQGWESCGLHSKSIYDD